jgi:hypothetical protein
MPFTPGQIATYLEFPGVCPFCGDGDIEAGLPEDLGGTELMLRQSCQTCGKNWREYFKLHDIEEEDAEGSAIPNEEAQEDQHVRAAGTEMLAALESVWRLLVEGKGDVDPVLDQVADAICKAKGRKGADRDATRPPK